MVFSDYEANVASLSLLVCMCCDVCAFDCKCGLCDVKLHHCIES